MGDTTHNTVCAERDHREGGFTLIELLVTLAIAAILATVAVPSYRSMIQRNAVAASANDLVGDLNYARSEAVTRGQTMMLCQSANQISCTTNDAGWSQGWIVYAPKPGKTGVTPDNRLRVHAAPDARIQISGNANVKHTIGFDANGFAQKPDGLSNGTLEVEDPDKKQVTQVVISTSGRVRAERTSGTSS